MGGLSSKHNSAPNPYAKKVYHQKEKVKKDGSSEVLVTPVNVQETIEDQKLAKESPRSSARYSNIGDDEFYDGIPRYRRSLTLKSRSLKVSEVGSLLGRAGSVSFERAVEVLDTLGSSVTNLSLTGGFVSGVTIKSNELSILSFEVANTIVKGSTLMQSLSKKSIGQLKEAVLPTEGIQRLISTDTDELLRIVAEDKREELKVFSGEVIRFGNRCKDPQWHNLNRFFEKRSRDRTPQKQSREVAESMMQQLMTSVQVTAELYQKLHFLDKSEQEYQRKRLEELKHSAGQRGDRDNTLNVLASELKIRRKGVKNLKKKSLWSRSMEEVMEKLVDIVLFLNQEINDTFGPAEEGETLKKESMNDQQKLGPAGLALHYANIILQIDSIVARSSTISPDSRDTLYQSLPPKLRASLRSKMQSFHVEKELTVMEIRDEMEKTLEWLAPVAANTAKAHHGFGWVGEWGNTGSDRTVGPSEVMQIETFHHAVRIKTDAYILDLLLWLNYLVNRYNASARDGGIMRPPIRSQVRKEGVEELKKEENTNTTTTLSRANKDLDNAHELGLEKEKFEQTNKDGSTSSSAGTRSSGDIRIDLGREDEKSTDMIGRVQTHI